MASLQVRDIPEDVRATLKRRAASAGQSLSEYVSAELARVARQLTVEEFSERVAARASAAPLTPAVEIVRAERSRLP